MATPPPVHTTLTGAYNTTFVPKHLVDAYAGRAERLTVYASLASICASLTYVAPLILIGPTLIFIVLTVIEFFARRDARARVDNAAITSSGFNLTSQFNVATYQRPAPEPPNTPDADESN